MRRLLVIFAFLSGLIASLRMDVRCETTISLLTARPGAEIYQLEGHSALRIVDTTRGDYVVNWGVFDFAAPNFVYRFVKGETDYMAGATPTYYFLNMYRAEGRSVSEQTLDLSPEETGRILELTDRNLMPENRTYRYDYVRDNCATRPLDIIEKAIGDSLILGRSGLPEEATGSFRNAMRYYHSNYPWYQFGIDLALGSEIDRPITGRELSFSPVALEEMMNEARRSSGEPIVKHSQVIVEGSSSSVILPPTPICLTPMFWSVILLVIAIFISWRQLRKGDMTISSKIFDTIYFSVAFVCGLILTFLIFVSVHKAASPNWLYLWLNPACIAGALLVWSKRGQKLLKYYQLINFALLMALVVVLISGIQSANPAFIPLIVADGVRALACVKTSRRNRNA